MACGNAMPQVAELAAHIREAFDELKSLPPTTALPAHGTSVAAGTPVASRKPKKAPAGRAKLVANATRATRASAPSSRPLQR
jgi:diacylglycerol O-acyltransferase